jgi:hypothetical protein
LEYEEKVKIVNDCVSKSIDQIYFYEEYSFNIGSELVGLRLRMSNLKGDIETVDLCFRRIEEDTLQLHCNKYISDGQKESLLTYIKELRKFKFDALDYQLSLN